MIKRVNNVGKFPKNKIKMQAANLILMLIIKIESLKGFLFTAGY